MRHAIIDLGTNTFNLLVYEKGTIPGSGPGLKIVHEEERSVRLGQGGLEHGAITADAFERGLATLDEYADIARSLNVISIKGYGCSTLRNAKNAPEFAQKAAEAGIAIEVLKGDLEAEIILDGVRLAVSIGNKPALIMDIGGGSIEFILATDKALMWKQSFEIGVTRLRERIPISDPILLEDEMRVAGHLDAYLDPLWSVIERHEPHVLIGSAGSFESIAHMLMLQHNEPIQQNCTSHYFTLEHFEDLKDRLMRIPRHVRRNIPGLPEHRVDTIIYALIAIERVLVASGIRTLAWSRYSLKEGAAIRELRATDHGNC